MTENVADRPVLTEMKIATLEGVREHAEKLSVEVWLNVVGRISIRAYNECGNNFTDVDLLEVLEWARGEDFGVLDNGRQGISSLRAPR